jgi:hypothetical protein
LVRILLGSRTTGSAIKKSAPEGASFLMAEPVGFEPNIGPSLRSRTLAFR